MGVSSRLDFLAGGGRSVEVALPMLDDEDDDEDEEEEEKEVEVEVVELSRRSRSSFRRWRFLHFLPVRCAAKPFSPWQSTLQTSHLYDLR